MSKKFLMGNEAIAMGALDAGVNIVCGYPGTPSTEITECCAKQAAGGKTDAYVEWSVNEKAALELAAGASYSGARTMVTMKQVGLNVASDPLMSLAYVGVKGGMIVVSADDPGPISSQTEQDTRTFAEFSKLPVFDPSSPQEAYSMVADAFELSEKYGTPVLFRPTTRVCHSCADVQTAEAPVKNDVSGFEKDTMRWVIFPKTSYLNHLKIEKRNRELSDIFSESKYNTVEGSRKSGKGIAAGGISYEYVKEALGGRDDVCLFKVSTPFPFPEKKALEFLSGLDEVAVYEELDPVIEKALVYVCGKYGLNVRIRGKLSGDVPNAGENSAEGAKMLVARLMGEDIPEEKNVGDVPQLPIRPPVLCAGCPHRASFYAVKKAVKGRKSIFCGDIGCYTLGNAKPLDMCDTCLCMGADVTIAQGMTLTNPDTLCFSFIGDSTFFASGLTGVVNAVYNGHDIILAVLDNSTTAMTGHQPNPSTGISATGEPATAISIEKVLEAIGVSKIVTVDPLKLGEATEAVKSLIDEKGVRAVIFRSPCAAKINPQGSCAVNAEKCVGCLRCINEIGCPAIIKSGGKAAVDTSLCFGCGLCRQICPVGAIGAVKADEKE